MYLMKLRGGGGAMEGVREEEGMRRENRGKGRKQGKQKGCAWEKARDE